MARRTRSTDEGLAEGGVHVVEVPGHHNDIIEKPHVSMLVRRLTECLGNDAPVPPAPRDTAPDSP